MKVGRECNSPEKYMSARRFLGVRSCEFPFGFSPSQPERDAVKADRWPLGYKGSGGMAATLGVM